MPAGDDVPYTPEEAARILNLDEPSFRSCLRAALFPVPSKRRPLRYSFQDLIALKTAKHLCEANIPIHRIRRVLQSLQRQLGPERQLWNLKIYADGKRVVVWDGAARWQPDSGQFLFNFEPQELRGTYALRSAGQPSLCVQDTAEQWFHRGMELEAHSPEEARHAYLEALRRDPALADAQINLGVLYHQNGEGAAAEACYRTAIENNPQEVWGYFNLAVLLDEHGDRSGAIQAYRQVIDRQTHLGDVHYRLAQLYEAEGRREDAFRHYAAAKRIMNPTPRHRRSRPAARPVPRNAPLKPI